MYFHGPLFLTISRYTKVVLYQEVTPEAANLDHQCPSLLELPMTEGHSEYFTAESSSLFKQTPTDGNLGGSSFDIIKNSKMDSTV